MTPALAIVVTWRHDNYGRDFNERFLSALQFNLTCLSNRGVTCEFILVEWNPVPERPHLANVLSHAFPAATGRTLRCFVVDPRYHTALTQNPQIGYLEYVAKNVGLRRASAPFVLTTNTDVFLGREVVEAIASQRLTPGTVYRAPRYDIRLGVDQSHLTLDALEDPAAQVRRPVLKPPLFAGGTGDFLLADRQTFHQLRGFNEVYRAARAGLDVNFVVKARGSGHAIADIGGPVYHVNHVGSFRISKGAYRHHASDTPWGNLNWHSRTVVYSNSDGWGLAEAPARKLTDDITYLEFDRRVVPPLVELRRVVLPARRVPKEAVEEVVTATE